ncbi:uncharacterized protein LOC128296705 [Anopheles moucheti]|uniref:uncharacterized protein LOC128296705 n=1 Tax=Anopheles moucheti TaxID=186751 RepID=UPI0022F10E42|nr:uncharacterized protein LOC128296705 [Anopheles moucheti]
MAELKQEPLSELEELKREDGEDSPRVLPAASPADTSEDTTDKGQDDGASCSPARESAEAGGNDESKATVKQEAEIAEDESTPNSEAEESAAEEESVKQAVGEKVAAAAAPEESSIPKQEIVSNETVPVKEEGETKEPTPPVTMEMQQTVVPGDDGGGVDDANSEPKVTELKGESRKRSQSEHSRRSRSSSSSSTSSNGNSTSAGGRSNTSNSGGTSSQCSSNSDSEGVSAAKKVKLEPVLEEPSSKRAEEEEKEEEDQEKTETVQGVRMDEDRRAMSESSRCAEEDERKDQETAIAGPEEQPISSGSLNLAKETKTCSPSAPASPAECSSIHEKAMPKMEQQPQNGREEGNSPEPLLLPPPPPPPPAPASMPRIETEVARVAVGGKLSIVAPILERPDSARLTADLQSCQRQLAEVRSKYDVTRKELHATKRKLKRMSVRLGTMTGGVGGSSVAPGGGTVGNASPHPVAVGPADEDRNRKWREPMIVAAMKIKTAMGIQAYKSLIKDGELLLPSLRTITRYLESLRKAGGGAAAAAALANAGTAATKLTAPIEVDDVPEEEDDEEDEEEEDGAVRGLDGVLQRRLDHAGGKRKQAKANGGGTGRTVDHNRNEQRRHPAYSAHRHPAQDVQLQDIKTEQDPVSFTASPDINYYQHNADDDDDEDEDGYQDPTSLLEESRYGEAGGMHLNGEDGGYHYGQQGQQPQQQQTLSQAQIEFLKSMVGFRKKWTPYELRTCNDIRRIIGSREYESLRRKDGMPLPSVKTLRKYRHAAHLPDGVDVMGRKRKLNELDDSPPNQSRTVPRYGSGGGGAEPGTGATNNGSGVLFPFGNDTDKELLKPEHDPDGGHFDVSILTLPQISFLQTLTMNTKGFSDYELQRSLELKNELGSGNYETLRKQEFLNIPTLAMLTRYEQDNGLEDLSRLNGRRAAGTGRKRHKSDESAIELLYEEEERRNREEQQAREHQQQEQEQEQQRQLELYNRLTQADPSRHPLFDSIAGDASPIEGVDPALTAAAIASAMAAAAAAGLHHPQLDHLNGSTAGGEDSSMSMFEHHSIFDKDTPMFDMTKLSPAHVEFLNTLPENPKRWTQEMINSALDIKNEIGTRDYEILRRQGIPLPAARTLRRHKDIRNKADRAMSETGEILPGSGSTTPAAGVVGGSG